MPKKSTSSVLLEIRKTCTRSVTRNELDRVALGAALRQLRMDKGISLRAMAKIIGVSPPYLSDMELGHRKFGLQHQMFFVKTCLK